MIEAVTVDQIKDIRLDLGDSFYKEFCLPGGFKTEAFIHNWTMLLSNNIGALWRLRLDNQDAGFLGGILTVDINNGDIIASELFWYVHPNFRKTSWSLRLMSTFENWAKRMGAKRVIMAHLLNNDGEKVGRFYKRKGYNPVEIHYMKEL